MMNVTSEIHQNKMNLEREKNVFKKKEVEIDMNLSIATANTNDLT